MLASSFARIDAAAVVAEFQTQLTRRLPHRLASDCDGLGSRADQNCELVWSLEANYLARITLPSFRR